MTMLHDVNRQRPSLAQKKRDPPVFQDKFATAQIPLPGVVMERLVAKIRYPYPPQVAVIGTLFPVPVPKEFLPGTGLKATRENGNDAYLPQSKSIVVSFSTAAGKTFLAELYMLKHVQRGKIAVYTCPLKALAEEKFNDFKANFPSLKIGIMTGDFHQVKLSELDKHDIIVMTFNKFDSILRNNRDKMVSLMSCAVIDEIHVIEDNPVVEDVVMKLKDIGIPVMGMSATIGNGKEMARWLSATLVTSNFRPVPVKIGVLIDDEIEYVDGTFESFNTGKNDQVEKIIAEKLLKGDQAMHVRQSRSMAESFAKRMVTKIGSTFFDKDMDLPSKAGDKEAELARCVKYGVAWHHAGVTSENRAYIENQFKEGKIRFICATTTLGAGINIPAKHVFMEWKRFNGSGSEPLKTMEVLQILHRAGRPQFDDEGYGVLVCKKEDEYEYCVNHYFPGKPEPVKSGLVKDHGYLFHSVIGNIGHVSTRDEILSLYKNSFAYHLNPVETLRKIDGVIRSFGNGDTAIVVERDGKFELTDVGKIVKRYYVNPRDAMLLVKMIKDSSNLDPLSMVHGVLRCESVYPLRVKGNDDEWYRKFTTSKQKLFYNSFNVNDDKEWKAFQTACILIGCGENGEMIYADESVSTGQLCYYYGIQAGDLQRTVGAQGNFSWLLGFASAVARLYRKGNILLEIDKVNMRLKYGISEKLVPVCHVKNVGRERGKVLFSVGYCDIESIATANPGDIAELKVNDKKIGIKIAESIVKSATLLVRKT